MSYCVYTVLFTLSDSKPEENQYIKIFQIWLSQLIKTNGVHRCVVLIDSKTFDYLKTAYILNKFILKKALFPISFIQFTPPKTLLEGMSYKYHKFNYDEENLVYTDLDVLLLKPLSNLNLSLEEALHVHAEGRVFESGYTDAMSEQEKLHLDEAAAGLSAGKFIIRGKRIRDLLFAKVLEYLKEEKKEFSTIEQPFFNRAIYNLKNQISINPYSIREPVISINCNDLTNDTVFVDFKGDPGNGKFHLDKIIDFVAYSNCT